MNAVISLPIDCIVISQPSIHTLQSSPLYIIPNPLQALIVHSGCHLGRFPFLPYAFHVVTYILSYHYNIKTGQRSPPFKQTRAPPMGNLIINSTNHNLITIPSNNNTNQSSHLPSQDITNATTLEHQQEEDKSRLKGSNEHTFHQSFLNIAEKLSFSFYSIFLLSGHEVSLLLASNIIRLIDGNTGKQIQNHQDLLPDDPFTNSSGYPIDTAKMMAMFGWRLMQTIRYACTDTVYRSKPYQGYSLFELAEELFPNQKIIRNQEKDGRPMVTHQCQIHSPQPPQQHSTTNNANTSTQTESLVAEEPAPPLPPQQLYPKNSNGGELFCTCPTVHLNTQSRSTRLVTLPVQHPPHDHSTYTFLYPQDLSHSHSSRQPIQQFVGYNSQYITRMNTSIKNHSTKNNIINNNNNNTKTDSQVTSCNNNELPASNTSIVLPDNPHTKNNHHQHSNQLQRPPTHVFLNESKSLSLTGHFETIVSLSSRVSKDSYKQLVIVKPIATAPISAYQSNNPVIDPVLCQNSKLTNLNDQGNVTFHDQEQHKQLISLFPHVSNSFSTIPTETTTLADLAQIFNTYNNAVIQPAPPLRLYTNVQQQQQQQEQQQQQQRQLDINQQGYQSHQPAKHVALVANNLKFQHYSNRVPVHTPLSKE